jgi:methylthioribose-1-phosphate isomerase
LSVLAKNNGIPFYVAAPSSTFDLSIKSGAEIPIEERPAEEITSLGQTKLAPDGVDVYNPAFDVTDAANITAIVTEIGVIESPSSGKISRHLAR